RDQDPAGVAAGWRRVRPALRGRPARAGGRLAVRLGASGDAPLSCSVRASGPSGLGAVDRTDVREGPARGNRPAQPRSRSAGPPVRSVRVNRGRLARRRSEERDAVVMATKAIVGEKVGMTQVWDDENRVVPVTVLRVKPCRVVQVKTDERDGYSALQVTFGTKKASKLSKP